MSSIPFVDLSSQHQPLQAEFDQCLSTLIAQGAFILGPDVAQFETAFAAASGSAHGVGVASGTDAIALGLRACGIGPGDEVLVPANTFIATLIGILRTGATPVLVDCDPDTALIDLDAAAAAITPRTAAIVPVHLYGQMVDPDALCTLATAHHLLLFEDAAQAHLAQRGGRTAGSLGTAAAYSFYPSKNLGCFGDGGMVITADGAIARTVRTYRNYGAAEKYLHSEWGTNSRLDNLQAAILNRKLPHLKDWNAARHQAAQRYDAGLAPLASHGIRPLVNVSGAGHIYHLYVIRVDTTARVNRDQLRDRLTAQGIQTGIHYPIPCHLQPAYHHLGYQPGDFPNAEHLAQSILSLPMYPGLTPHQTETVINAIQQAATES
ncbi:DegT/DnrJ/EryC1/StrS family aminotransferase [Spirulina major CS-329]|uniref:DegT/DnrJ/EryC1/StrS family aminotransferase n=1 Tax=Spirulina TaxID=1154 RepID=UPI00232FDD39|nr:MULTISPECIES: DegT/DnrJ/EryC1/StrS family aminotransferase [Spirulina]MDB9493688.1 DegT/DnrJ/EryC1/StrS family aminotransferase [Spirulina subsalsa CS-330]MDB9505255.1 DegT/DnrJ/EryC1/StrS family aminotransferase [Spirulina major CS-329]